MKASVLLYAVAATATGLAIQLCDGEYRPTMAGNAAMLLITVSILATAVAVAGPRRITQFELSGPIAPIFFAGLLAIQFTYLLRGRPDSIERSYLLRNTSGDVRAYGAVLIVGALAAAFGVWRFGATRSLRMPGTWVAVLIASFAAAGLICLHATHLTGSDTTPHIDVFVFQQQGARVLLAGRDPYRITDYPDIYQSGTLDPATGVRRQEVYGPGMSDGRTVDFGFPYLPGSLLLTTIGYGVAGDYRVAQVAAIVLAALLLYRLNRQAALCGALLLFTPRCFFVLISGWTEPLLVMWLAATMYCAVTRSRWLPVALGMLLATKQYMVLALPVTYLLVPPGEGSMIKRWLTLLGWTAAVALTVTLPLALWDWRRFYFSAFTVQRYAPFRWDALSYMTWHAFGHGPPSERAAVVWPSVATVLTLGLCIWRSRPSPAHFAGATALILLAFIAFNKQAFANYYFFVIGALCCAAATSDAGNFQSEATSRQAAT